MASHRTSPKRGPLVTPLTELLGIQHPVLLAGMFKVSTHRVCAAVSNAGGLGSIGGLSYNPKMLRKEIGFIREELQGDYPFGVDLLIPKVGEGARATNKDYTNGKLSQLCDVMIEEKIKLFTCAVGVPPKWMVDKLHSAGIVCMNMVGAPHHVPKALAVGMDIICAQGTEAGGHTGDIATLPLIPQCVDLCRGKKNFFGTPVLVVAAGGIYDGRGLAAALALGASGVWCGTRFVASEESTATKKHKSQVVATESRNTARTPVFTGRPARGLRTDYVISWEQRTEERDQLLKQGIIPWERDHQETHKGISGVAFGAGQAMGQACGGIQEVLPARVIVHDMVHQAARILESNHAMLSKL